MGEGGRPTGGGEGENNGSPVVARPRLAQCAMRTPAMLQMLQQLNGGRLLFRRGRVVASDSGRGVLWQPQETRVNRDAHGMARRAQ